MTMRARARDLWNLEIKSRAIKWSQTWLTVKSQIFLNNPRDIDPNQLV